MTGGSSGIGRCIAETLSRDGCDVGIFYLGEPGDGTPVLDAIEAHGQRGWARVGDVADSGQVNQAVEGFIEHFGGIDILVNNAGIFRDQVIWKMTDEQWQPVIDVDLTGVFNCARAASATEITRSYHHQQGRLGQLGRLGAVEIKEYGNNDR